MVIEAAKILVPAAIIAFFLVRAMVCLRGTTLVAPTAWAALSLVAVCGTELIGLTVSSASPPGWLIPARYSAAMTTFCPLMAVLGAKRPQDRAWQLIVLALIGILTLPAMQDLVYRYGQPVSLHAAWQWFLVVLIVAELVNYLPTHNAAAVALATAGQVILIAQYLPFGPGEAPEWRVPVTLALMAAGCVIAALRGGIRREAADPLMRLRQDFRDCYGMLWAVRIEQRAASTSTQSDADDEHATAALLSRFVSRAWIDSRLQRTASESPPHG